MVLLDANGVTVTATGFDNDYFGPVMKLHVVNNTDTTVNIGCDHFVLNGYSAVAYLYITVEAGGETDDVLYLADSSLDLLETEYIGEITMQIFASDDNFDEVATGEVLTLRTSDYDKDWDRSIEGTEIFSEDGLTVKLVSVTRGEYWPSTDFTILVENDTDMTLSVEFSNILVNGEDVYAWFYDTVYPGTRSFNVLSIDDDSLAEIGADVMETLEVAIVAYNADTYEEVIKSLGFVSLPVGVG